MGINSIWLYLLSIVQPAIIVIGFGAFVFALITIALFFICENNSNITYRSGNIEALLKSLDKLVHKLENIDLSSDNDKLKESIDSLNDTIKDSNRNLDYLNYMTNYPNNILTKFKISAVITIVLLVLFILIPSRETVIEMILSDSPSEKEFDDTKVTIEYIDITADKLLKIINKKKEQIYGDY